MIPIHDSIRSRSFPYVNLAIIAVNFIIFFYEVTLSQQHIHGQLTQLDIFIYHWGNIPACTLDSLGQHQTLAVGDRMICASQPEPLWTVFTALFIHGSWLHILGNMLFLLIFGDNVEDSMGHALYAVFYLLVGGLSSFAHMFVNASDIMPAVGASGAIAGVMGAYIVLFPRATVAVIIPLLFFLPFPVPALLLIGLWFLAQVFSGFASLGVSTVGSGGGVAYFAHIGGFVAGALLVNLFAMRRRGPPARRSSGLW